MHLKTFGKKEICYIYRQLLLGKVQKLPTPWKFITRANAMVLRPILDLLDARSWFPGCHIEYMYLKIDNLFPRNWRVELKKISS